MLNGLVNVVTSYRKQLGSVVNFHAFVAQNEDII